jgi:CubicO group peptidase (beta-lactamase class C family)
LRQILLAAIAWLLMAPMGFAADLPSAAPADVGIGRLDRITGFFKADTAAKRIPGAVIILARNGKVVYHEAFGVRDPATGAPMQKDSIFRIYSMTSRLLAWPS